MTGPSNTAPARKPRGRPPRIDQERAVATALAVLDAEGLDALTMRRLAAALDVQVGTLYGHFADKPALLTAMAERMLHGCAEPWPTDPDWQAQVTELARRMRLALLRHRDGARVYAGTRTTGPNTLNFADTFVGVLTAAGFTAEDAVRASFTVIRFVIGHTLEEQAGDDRLAADVESLHRALTTEDYPQLAAAAHVITSADLEGYFEFGIRALVAGLRELPRKL